MRNATTALALGALILAGAPASADSPQPPGTTAPGKSVPGKPAPAQMTPGDRKSAKDVPGKDAEKAANERAKPARPEIRIRDAFVRLGMEAKRSACYGRVIAGALDGDSGARAAAILERAKGAQDVRDAVTSAGGPVMAAFLLARLNCG